jgi:hypothetical protein
VVPVVGPVVADKPPTPPGKPPAARSRARAVASSTDRPPPLGGEDLQTVVTRAHPRFVACFRRYTSDLSAATGQATVELAVASSGKVSLAKARLPGITSPALARCLEEEGQRLRFPRHPDREIRFAFPLVYRKGQ